MTRIAVIDHGAGNLVSIVNALTAIGEDPRVVSSPDDMGAAEAVVLPGVGATAPAMRRLVETGLDDALRAWDGPLLGICVGFQLLFDDSDEDGQACLGVIPGTVREITGRPLPHMGWNDVEHSGDPVFSGIPSGEPFYFVHSFAPVPKSDTATVATTRHGGSFVAAARDGNRVGVQFHPERSGVSGARLLANFVAIAKENRRVA
ncbi:MAG: imidazole glycerol phosphate synthase subunit HisH [Acidimicrobiia bacterium]|nr:MAG: imidazole glycerol phosphate synthase subunit HisH [Acidimicrobiia bacterium]